VLRNAAQEHGVGYCFQNTQTVDPTRNVDGKALPRELVDQRHLPDFAPVMGPGFDEVVRPDTIAPFRSESDAGAVVEP